MAIVVIKQGALGDVIMATPLIAAIQRAHAADTVWLLTSPAYAGLFAAWDGLRVQAFPRRGAGAMWATLCWLRRGGFSRVYDLQGNDRSAVLCALSGIRTRIGHPPRFPYNCHPPGDWHGETHVFERLNEVLRAAGIPPAAARPVLPCTADERAQVAGFLAARGLTPGAYVVMHAGASASRPEKCWPGYGVLATALAARGLTTLWLGGADDAARNRELATRIGIDATGRFSIPQLAELALGARFAVTNDSGPMHALAAAGIPVFGLFGPSDWRRNHALGQAANVLAGVELLPDLAGRRVADCLARISPEMVLQRLSAQGLLET